MSRFALVSCFLPVALNWWICVDSREAGPGRGPILEIRAERGFEVALEAVADAPLLAYLPRRNFAGYKKLPVGVGDKNRSLMRFELPEALRKRRVTRAELVLAVKMGKRTPKSPVTIALHACQTAWTEKRVTWQSQPAIGDPISTRRIAPKAAALRWDVTGLAKQADLGKALATFMKYRAGLRGPVKLDSAWASPNNYSSYFYFYAYYHAARAAEALGGRAAKRMKAAFRDEMLATAEPDATWVDYPQVGKVYGTAAALLVLAMTGR